jgi:two-component system cell cycle sensor histidine kinase/response regulator CckA
VPSGEDLAPGLPFWHAPHCRVPPLKRASFGAALPGAFAALSSWIPAISYRGLADQPRTLLGVRGSCRELTGYAAAEFAEGSVCLADLIHPDDVGFVTAELQAAVLEQRDFQLSYRICSADDEERSVWEIGTAEYEPTSAATVLRGCILDISRAPHVQAQAIVEGLAAGVAHDLCNLLSVVTAGTELLLRTLGEQPEARFRVEQMREAAQSSGRLASQLARLVGQRPLNHVAVNLNEVVTRMEPVLRALVGDELQLSLALDPELEPTLVDPVQLERVLLNLTTNARQAMPQGGRVRIGTQNVHVAEDRKQAGGWLTRGSYVRLSVSDSGPGLDPRLRERIFLPAFSTKGSSGLGLATIRQIAEQCGGSVDVQSEHGQGSTFEVYLPRSGDRGKSPVSQVVSR